MGPALLVVADFYGSFKILVIYGNQSHSGTAPGEKGIRDSAGHIIGAVEIAKDMQKVKAHLKLDGKGP